MHTWYLLGVFLLFGIDGSSSIGKFSLKDKAFNLNPETRETKLVIPIKDDLFGAKQVDELENAVNIVYKHFFGPPPSKLTLRSNHDGKSGLSDSISIIGDTVCNHIKNMFKKFGVSSPNNGRDYTLKSIESKPLKFVVFYQLMKMPLEIQPIVQQIQGQTKKYFNKNKYAKLGYRRRDFSFSSYRYDSENEWQNLAISNVMRTYTTNIINCLEESNVGSFDIEKALGKLMNYSPETVGHVVRRRLDKPLPKYPAIRKSEYTEMHAFICHAIVDDPRINVFRKCLVQIKFVDKCVDTKLNDSSSRNAHSFVKKSSENFVETVNSLDPTCSNFRGEMGFLVKCRESQTILKSNEFSYVTDFFLGDLKKSPVINQMSNEFVSTIQKTRIGVDTTREIATLISIYQNAEEKTARSLKTSRKDNENKISQNLVDYEQNLARMGLKTFENVNKAITNVEQIFVDSNQKVSRHDLSPNVKVLKCFNDVMELIFSRYWLHKQYDMSDHNITASRTFVDVRNEIGFLKNPFDQRFKELVNSMIHVTQSPSPRHSSALVALAKTFLLATMFYECMAILAGVLHRGDNDPVYQNYDAENYVNDNWEIDAKVLPRQAKTEDRSIEKRVKEKRAVWLSDIRNKLIGNTIQTSALVIHDHPRLYDN